MRLPGPRSVLAGVLAAAVVLAVPADAAPKPKPKPKPKPGPNVLPNPSFEQSAIEGTVLPPGSAAQPVLPTGWVFEGSAVLFDHTPNSKRTGKRAIAISGPASGSRRICQNGTCTDNPANGPKDTTAKYYSVTPHWRTLDPVPVKPNVAYRFAVWVSWQVETVGEGASTKVRWMDASGQPISESPAVILRATAETSLDLPWKLVSAVVRAPANAASAHVLLGNTDDAWISQVRYDDVHFGTA